MIVFVIFHIKTKIDASKAWYMIYILLLNFGDRSTTGVFSMVCTLPIYILTWHIYLTTWQKVENMVYIFNVKFFIFVIFHIKTKRVTSNAWYLKNIYVGLVWIPRNIMKTKSGSDGFIVFFTGRCHSRQHLMQLLHEEIRGLAGWVMKTKNVYTLWTTINWDNTLWFTISSGTLGHNKIRGNTTNKWRENPQIHRTNCIESEKHIRFNKVAKQHRRYPTI